MSLNEEMEMLRRVPMFAAVPPSKLKLLAFTSDRVAFDADRVIFNQGDQGDAAYVLLSGAADLLVDTPGGVFKVAAIGQNEIVGEIALLCNVPRTATVKTTAPVVALRIWKDDFLRLIAEFPEMAIEIMRVLASRLSHTTADLTNARSRLKMLEK